MPPRRRRRPGGVSRRRGPAISNGGIRFALPPDAATIAREPPATGAAADAHDIRRPRHDDSPHRRTGIRLYADVRVPADLDEGEVRGKPRMDGRRRLRPADRQLSSCVSSPTSSRRRTTTSWSIPASATTRPSRCGRPGTARRTATGWRRLKAAGLAPEDIDFVMCTHLHGDHVGWNTRLENGRWVPTFPKARYLFSQKEYAYWSEVHQKTPLDNDLGKRAADHRSQPRRARHQRPRAQRPHPADPDPRPHARPFRRLRRPAAATRRCSPAI